jgi:septal ring factor EnvC (AmiA/AmiB activator)
MEFLFHTKYIALDKFKKIPQNIDSDKKQWISLLAANTPEEIQNVAAMSEEFFDIIVEISEFVQDVGKVMNMFSEALYMLDRNTEELMYNEAMQELKETRKELEEQKKTIQEQKKANEELKKQAEEQLQKYNQLTSILLQKEKYDDLKRVTEDESYRMELYKKYEM